MVKPTLKALEHDLQMKKSSRRAILGQLTEKKNELYALMDDDANVEIIAMELYFFFCLTVQLSASSAL